MLVRLSGVMACSKKIVEGVFCLVLLSSCASTSAEPVLSKEASVAQINALYQTVLERHVYTEVKNGLPANMVRYGDLAADADFKQVRVWLAHYSKEALVTQSQQLAFYLNAYNILAMEKVAQNWPLKSLRGLGNFLVPVWTHDAGKLCGEDMTLRILEHEILRSLGDPRIHFALNCASMSCPDLRFEPYAADRIDAQLDEQSRIFLTQIRKGIQVTENEVVLSPLFDWFDEDFEAGGGVQPFVEKYAPVGLLPANWEIDDYLNYDWSVNDIFTPAEKRRL
jgi:hypothetical protein